MVCVSDSVALTYFLEENIALKYIVIVLYVYNEILLTYHAFRTCQEAATVLILL